MDRQHRRELKHDRFVDELGTLSDKARDNQPFRHLLVGAARYSVYQLRIDGGEGPQVAQELQAQIGKPDSPLPSDTLLVLLAHAYDAQGNTDKSKETYRRIVTEYPDSPYAVEAQRRVGGAA